MYIPDDQGETSKSYETVTEHGSKIEKEKFYYLLTRFHFLIVREEGNDEKHLSIRFLRSQRGILLLSL